MMEFATKPAGFWESRLPWVMALIITCLWGVAYMGFSPGPHVDESWHLEVMRHFSEGRPGIPDALPILPGYHLLVVALTGGEPSLQAARLVSWGMMLVAVFVFGVWSRRLHGTHTGGWAALILAACPLTLPYGAMAYTDISSLALLLAAGWLQTAQRRGIAAIVFTLACLVRQTNLLWVAYAWVLETVAALSHARSQSGGTSFSRATIALFLRELVRRTAWLTTLLCAAGGVVIWAGRLSYAKEHGNPTMFNPAVFHGAAWVAILLSLPAWGQLLARRSSSWFRAARIRPGVTAVVVLAASAGVFALTKTYANPHEWNRAMHLDGMHGILLRNWPLLTANKSPFFCVLSSALIVVGVAGLWFATVGQPYARAMRLGIFFGLILLMSNALVEPRYLITPVVGFLLSYRWPPGTQRWIIMWFLLLSCVHAPFIIMRESIW